LVHDHSAILKFDVGASKVSLSPAHRPHPMALSPDVGGPERGCASLQRTAGLKRHVLVDAVNSPDWRMCTTLTCTTGRACNALSR
jgi:hypothetical protein